MKYGFLIDHRKCIGCHACTVACKSEHNVPIGVNRTWVKYIERGTYPNSRRFFTVLRCNHCEDAPCVKICPVGALFNREDGIVDFNQERCIGCKSCTLACPYDSIYINPETDTAAKCNFCAHRIDVGLNPACVNICPEQAILAGDIEDPQSKISKTIGREQVQARKVEKGTIPKLFYINGDAASLNPMAAPPARQYQQTEQAGGVGHYAKYNEKRSDSESCSVPVLDGAGESQKLLGGGSKRTHDAPSKGILWGWELPAYLWTKAIAAGVFVITALASLFSLSEVSASVSWFSATSALGFVVLTSIALVKDLDKPSRFLYIFLRPQYSSWLTRGGLIIASFGFFITLWMAGSYLQIPLVQTVALWGSVIAGGFLAIYTAFLLAQAKGIDFWQSSLLPIHMAVQSALAGSSFFLVSSYFIELNPEFFDLVKSIFGLSVIANLAILLAEITMAHPTSDAKLTVKMITGKKFGFAFFAGVILLGNLVPAGILWQAPAALLSVALPVAGVLALAGFYLSEHIWIKAPQLVARS